LTLFGSDHDRALCRGHANISLAGIVGIERFDWPPEHTAGLVDAVQSQLRAILLGLSPVGHRPAENSGNADFDRFGSLSKCTAEQPRSHNKNAPHTTPPGMAK
jgi:hypothetical protein